MKKKNKLLFIATLSTACLLSLASCQGAQGPKGDKGDPGINGTNGTNGTDGTNGSSVLTGKGVPASSLGSDGDSYIDTDTFDFYSKKSGAWSKVGNIKGSTGEQGSAGEQGEEGKKGTSLLSGSGAPSSELGNDGDSYIDTTTFDFYLKASGTWTKYGNIKGADGSKGEEGSKGEDGKQGTSVLTGKGVPASTLGNDGDSYIDLETFDFYTKTSGAWTKAGSIKGEKGDQGEQGEKGDKGNSGWSGSKGDTAWSNTILPSTGGYVTVDVGSAVVGQTVTFTVHASQGYTFDYLKVENKNLKDGYKIFQGESNIFSIEMMQGGFVVNARFFDTEAGSRNQCIADSTTYANINAAVVAGKSDIKLLAAAKLTKDIFVPSTKVLKIDLNGYSLDCSDYKIYGHGELNFVNSSDTANVIKGNNSTGLIVQGDAEGSYDTVQSSSFKLDGGKFNTISLMSKSSSNSSNDNTITIGKNVIFSLSNGQTAIKSSVKGAKISVSSNAEFKNAEGDVSGTKAIEIAGGTAEISGTINTSSATAVSVTGASTISGSLTLNTSDSAKGVEVNVADSGTVTLAGSVTASSGTAVTVTQGAVTVDESAEISAKNDAKAVEVAGGTVSVEGSVSSQSGTAVSASAGKVTVSANATVTTTSQGSTAIEVSGGDVTVNGTVSSTQGTAVAVSSGSLTVATDETASSEKTASISSGSGDGVSVTGGTVTVSSGEVKTSSSSGAAINVDSSKSTTAVNVNITGGTITNTDTTSGSAIKQTSSNDSTSVTIGTDTTIKDSENKEDSTEVVYNTVMVEKSKIQLVREKETNNKSIKITISSEESDKSGTLAKAIKQAVALDKEIADVVINLPASSTDDDKIVLNKLSELDSALTGKNVTLCGATKTENGKKVPATIYESLKTDGSSEHGSDYTFQYAKSIKFENIIINLETKNYNGFVRGGDYTFKNCTIKGMLTYVGSKGSNVNFENCTFDSMPEDGKTEYEYNIWTYCEVNYSFNGCTFNSQDGNFFNVYTDQTHTLVSIKIEDCTFNGSSTNIKPILCVKLYNSTNWDIEWKNNTVTGVVEFDETSDPQIKDYFKTDDAKNQGYGYYKNIFGVKADSGKQQSDSTTYGTTVIKVWDESQSAFVTRFSNLTINK